MCFRNKNMSDEVFIEDYLNKLVKKLVSNKNKIKIGLTREWARQFPSEAGVYVLFEAGELVYVGETGSIKERMTDYLDTRHHTVRRKIGKFNFSNIKGYKSATSKLKFPPHIEKMVEDWLKEKIKLCYVVVSLGRKELEEKIIYIYKPKYNTSGNRRVKNK